MIKMKKIISCDLLKSCKMCSDVLHCKLELSVANEIAIVQRRACFHYQISLV